VSAENPFLGDTYDGGLFVCPELGGMGRCDNGCDRLKLAGVLYGYGKPRLTGWGWVCWTTEQLVNEWTAKGSKLERVEGVESSDEEDEEEGEEDNWEVIFCRV
jgi:hypothetical protein